MENSPLVPILLFHHPDHHALALTLKTRIEAQGNITLCQWDISSKIDPWVLDTVRGLVILYSPDLEADPNLFEIIQAIQKRPQLERFLILPQTQPGEKVVFPLIFHPLRAQQHHIFSYPSQSYSKIDHVAFLESFAKTFQDRLPMMENALKAEPAQIKRSFVQRFNAFWHGPRKSIVTVSMLIILALAGFSLMIFPQFLLALGSMRAPKWIGFQPPMFSALWINEPFDEVNTDRWVVQNRYEGRTPLALFYNDEGLGVQAEPFTQHALLQVDGVDTYPLDQWEGFGVSFRIDALPATAGRAEIVYGIALADDGDYQLGCRVSPHGQTGEVMCFIQEPEQTVQVSAPWEIELDRSHEMSVEFIPESYVVRFYLDGDYFGRASIPTISLWRGKAFLPTLQVEVWDMTSQGVLCQVNHYQLAHQP
jgi:hypothetical protein